MIRPMREADFGAVRTIQRLCHPTWPERVAPWNFAHPTLVLEEGGEIIGTTSFSVSIATDSAFQNRGSEVAYGHGVSVHPTHRGERWGWALAEARHAILRELGITFFIGFTQPANAPMLAIFARQHLLFHTRLPKVYPDGHDGLMYVGGIT